MRGPFGINVWGIEERGLHQPAYTMVSDPLEGHYAVLNGKRYTLHWEFDNGKPMPIAGVPHVPLVVIHTNKAKLLSNGIKSCRKELKIEWLYVAASPREVYCYGPTIDEVKKVLELLDFVYSSSIDI